MPPARTPRSGAKASAARNSSLADAPAPSPSSSAGGGSNAGGSSAQSSAFVANRPSPIVVSLQRRTAEALPSPPPSVFAAVAGDSSAPAASLFAAAPAAAAAASGSSRIGVDVCQNSYVILVCLLVWLHGATFGATIGDGFVKPFVVLTAMFFFPMFALWSMPSWRRLIVSFLYFIFASYAMSIVSALSWFRNPAHLPPLPDIIHDILPEITRVNLPFWHQDPHLLPDLFISSLTVATLIFVLTNTHRFVILRRFFIIYGTLMCMRTITIVVTNLPDALPKCHELTRFHHWDQIDVRSVIRRAMRLLIPVGEMTCGDMVFSGHSMILCLEAMIWQTYYKRAPGLRFNVVKLTAWAVVVMGLFSILAVRLHYTLDVILAVYFSITVWSAYHRIAHDIAVGHHFSMIWLIDHVVIYPAIRWFEAPLDELDTCDPAVSQVRADHPHAAATTAAVWGAQTAVAATKPTPALATVTKS